MSMLHNFTTPAGTTHYHGTLLDESTEVGFDSWFEVQRATEGVISITGMQPDDEIIIESSCTFKQPRNESEILRSKVYKSNGEKKHNWCKWIRVYHSKASGMPVTVHFMGRG